MNLSVLARLSSHVPSYIKMRLHRVRPLYAKALHGSIVIKTRFGNVNWQLDELTCAGYLNGQYEPYMQDAIERYLQPGITVYDIGAHAGYYSLLLGLKSSVIAFEPHPENLKSIRSQLNANPGASVRLLPYALSDTNGTANLGGPSRSQATLSYKGIEVETRTIDSLVGGGLPPPNLIKIDVEGHDPQALMGGMKTISQCRPVILCDPNDDSTEPSLRELLEPLDYKVYGPLPVICEPQ